ncbi:hypothetical protein F5Y03DRAFT_372709 [Xylaria venustula]|nr:hypothetical protein F5Y03DRAFT_372709 [Xylaria venustula]
MASTPKMKSDRDSLSMQLPTTSILRKPTGSNKDDPIVLDDDDDDEIEDGTWALQLHPSIQHVPSKKRKITSVDGDVDYVVTPPRTFGELLPPDSSDKDRERLEIMERIQSEISRLQSVGLEKDRLEEENNTLSVILDATKKSEEVYKARSEQLEQEISEIQESLRSAQSQTADAVKENDLLKKEVAAQKRLEQEQRDEIANMRKAEQHAQNEASLAIQSLKTMTSEAQVGVRETAAKIYTLQAELDRSIATSITEKSGMQKELEKANATISTLRTELSNTQEEHKAAKATISSSQIKHGDIIATTNAKRVKAENELYKLQSHLSSKKKAIDAMKVERNMDLKRMKEVTDERGELIKRINLLESKQLADAEVMERQVKELAEAASTHATAEANFQARIYELEGHMEICPIAQKSDEFWDNFRKESLERRRLLIEDLEERRKLNEDIGWDMSLGNWPPRNSLG